MSLTKRKSGSRLKSKKNNSIVLYAVRKFINIKYGIYGQMTRLSIKENVASVSLSLKGEKETIGGEIDFLIEDNSITLGDMRINREWINVLAAEFGTGRTIQLSPKILNFVKLII